jgi:hypothetical protein
VSQRAEIAKAVRFFSKNPRISEKGIMYIGKKLQETEEEEGESLKLLKSAHQYLRRGRYYRPEHPVMLNIRRLSRTMGE